MIVLIAFLMIVFGCINYWKTSSYTGSTTNKDILKYLKRNGYLTTSDMLAL